MKNCHVATASVRCSACLCGEAVPLPYRWYELPLALLLLRPYKCSHCYQRFLAFLRLAG